MTVNARSAARGVLLALLAAAVVRVSWTALQFFQNGRVGRHRVEAAWMILAAVALMALAASRRSSSLPLEKPPASGPRNAAWATAFLAGAICLYWPAITTGLLSDDFFLLGRSWQDTLGLSTWEHFRPLPLLVWKLIFPLGGSVGLHLLNILLHGANAWLTGVLLRRIGHSQSVAMAAGLIFLTFPGAVEPVVWCSGVFDVTLVTFGLLYLCACVERRSAWITLLPLVAALLSKETAVMLPVLAACVGFRSRISRRTLVLSVAVTVAYVAMRKLGGIPLPLSHPANLAYTIKDDLARPFAALAVPFTAGELARWPLLLGVAPTVAVALLVSAYCLRSSAGIRIAVGPLIVLSGIVPLWMFFYVDDNLQGARYVYLPLVGWTVFVADLIANRALALRRDAAVATVIFAVCSAWAVHAHLRPWREAATIRDAVLHSAAATVSKFPCPYPDFTNLPDSVDGAFIFRNGFPEAAQLPKRPVASTAAPCVFTWTNGAFIRTN
jgi:hypothetical protein